MKAEVFYGDTRVRADLVRTTVFGPLLQRKVRVETDAPINEPVVTVSLRAGCQGSITRSYTLLPGLAAPDTLVADEGSRPASGATRPLGPAAVAARLTASLTPPAEPAAVVMRAASSTRAGRAERTAGADRAVRAKASAPAVARGPRLTVEPLDFDPPAVLRVSASLSTPGGDLSKRAAAALLWQALNADPQEILRTSAMLQKLEHDLVALRQADLRTRGELAALRQRLDAPQPWYRSAGLAQLLVLLLAGVSALAAILWKRGGRWTAATPEWYAPAEPHLRADAAVPPAAQHIAEAVASRPLADHGARTATGGPADAAPAIVPFSPQVPAPGVAQADAALQPTLERAPQAAARVETLAAMLGELEFLAAVGGSRNAVEVLQDYLAGSTTPAPLAFFELMRLYARAEDADGLAALRLRYTELFGQEPPSLEQVTATIGLESMRELSARISEAWGTRQAVHLIEQGLFQAPPGEAVITLQAARELLSLYELAIAITSGDIDQAEAPADAHPLAPWADAGDAWNARPVAVESPGDAAGGDQFALDVDLSAPAPLAREDRPPLEFAPFLAELQAQADSEAAARVAAEQEDAFSAAVAFERVPASRY